MKDTLKKFLSARGDILSDDRSNQIIIRDIPSVIPTIDNLLHQLDRKSQQVEIEARVISASRAFSQDIGTELGFAGTTTSGRSALCGAPQVGVSPIGRCQHHSATSAIATPMRIPVAASPRPVFRWLRAWEQAFRRAASASRIGRQTSPSTSSSPQRKPRALANCSPSRAS